MLLCQLTSVYDVANLFQSSPNPRVGCFQHFAALQRVRYDWFQSSPNPTVGCFWLGRYDAVRGLVVSILTQPSGWVLP